MTPEQRSALRRIDRQFDAVRAMPEPIPPRDRYRHGIEDVRQGGYLRCAGQLYQVVTISAYREKAESWSELELFSLTSGGTTYLEWEKDDEVECRPAARCLRARNAPPTPGQPFGCRATLPGRRTNCCGQSRTGRRCAKAPQ